MNKSLVYLIFLTFFSCGNIRPTESGTIAPSHESWNILLKKYVDTQGLVDYHSFQKDSSELNKYLELLNQHPPDTNSWTKEEELAYYINLYNAATVQLVLRHYPLKSIKDIGPSIQIPRVNTPWQIRFIEINNKKYSLDDIEHGIIRTYFSEERIHFALVCAAISCPPLRNEAYISAKLDEQLNDQTLRFLKDTTKNTLSNSSWELSSIFLWYGGDFQIKGGVVEFIANTLNLSVSDPTIDFKDYNWALNDQNPF